jgi:hypothetical protein
MPTGVVKIGSDLERRKWMREGMIQAASRSFWTPMTGSSKDAVVFQANNENSKEGHTVVFDFDGNLSGKAIKGKETAFGKGEQKRKFSDKITVERYRLPVDNGDKFDGVNIGDLSINEHMDSRSKLGDLWTRWKDQALFDAAQGIVTTLDESTQDASHVIDLGTTFNFNTLLDIERTLKTSQGYSTGGIRAPLTPYRVETGINGSQPVWIMLLDVHMANALRKDTAGWQTIIKDGDVRGGQNRNLTGVLGRVGSLILMEAPSFFGYTAGNGAGFTIDDSEVEISGLRQYDTVNDAWTGQEGFSFASTLQSRGLILGAGALQCAMGKQPDYKFQESEDFGIKSESALEVWTEVRKARYKLESGKSYKQAKIDGIDNGVVAVDFQVS